jgi:hypothetical protein
VLGHVVQGCNSAAPHKAAPELESGLVLAAGRGAEDSISEPCDCLSVDCRGTEEAMATESRNLPRQL